MRKKTRKSPEKALVWKDGVGYLPIDTSRKPYDRHYFERLQKQERTAIQCEEVKLHIKMVQQAISYRRTPVYLLDVGCGSGHFLRELKRTTQIHGQGIDINEKSIQWLIQKQMSVTREKYTFLTFWDSFCHCELPDEIIRAYDPAYIGISLPIFTCKEQITKSDLFLSDEVHWYFTKFGFIEKMKQLGYCILESSYDLSTKFHKDHYQSFIFARIRMNNHIQ